MSFYIAMRVGEITDKKIWEDFLQKCTEKTFFDSWNWGEFNKKMGDKIWRFGIYEDEVLLGVALVVKVTAKRGTFLTVSHGPITKSQEKDMRSVVLKALLDTLERIGRAESASFIRISPIWERNEENIGIFGDLGFREAPMYAAAESSWKLDITPSEEKLLANMRKTTRYLIRQTLQNKDIEVVKSNKLGDMEVFDKLNREVGKRQQFIPFSLKYTKTEFEIFAQDESALLLFGKFKGEIVASALVIFWSGIGFYHQAASLGAYAKLALPYRLQWEAIKEAKLRGCVMYDFWGYVDPKKYPKHPWAGPTLFKMGFGGQPYEYVKTQDFPLSMRYWITATFEKIRKVRRHL